MKFQQRKELKLLRDFRKVSVYLLPGSLFSFFIPYLTWAAI